MRTQLFTFILLFIVTVAFTQSDLTNLPNVERVGDFQAGLWITDDRDFFDRFETETTTPELRFVNKIGRNENVFVFLLLSNAPVDPQGKSSIKMKYSTFRPSGDQSYEGEQLNAYEGPALPRNRLHLSADIISLKFNDSDPLGVYEIRAEVLDEISGASLNLVFPLTLLDKQISNPTVEDNVGQPPPAN